MSFEAMLVDLIRTDSRSLFRLAWRVLHDADAAEDVCQQAYLKAWETRAQIREPAALRAWLTRVVLNGSLQLTRQRKRLPLSSDFNDCPGGDDPDLGAPERAELKNLLDAAIAELPDLTQEVVVLRLLEEMSGNEVKSILGCSASEVSRRLHHGMEHLRRRLGKTYMPG